MTKLRALLAVAILWAAIYLPGLGSTEIKGEEGRRILPAITMLETGNWLVPYVGGKPFLRKPPLVNWAIAGAFKISNSRSEWAARMPSALCVLALGLTIVGMAGEGWLGVETSLVAAIFAMTQFGLVAKARFAGAEIEGIYAPISGIAIVTWLAWWSQRRSAWLVWLVPWTFLGVAALAKGPSLHLLFFYAVVIAALAATKEWRWLWHPAHFVGIAIGAAIFAAWAVPFFHSPEAREAAAVWKRQGIDRFTDSEFEPGNFFMNIPRGLADQLPWLLLAPVAFATIFRGKIAESVAGTSEGNRRGGWRTARWIAIAVPGCFFALLLVPGTLPRYVLPLGAVIALLLAAGVAASANERLWTRWHAVNRGVAALLLLLAIVAPFSVSLSQSGARNFVPVVLAAIGCAPLLAVCAAVFARRAVALRPANVALATGALFGVAAVLFAIAGVPWMHRAEKLRPLAARIDAAVPAGQRIVLFDVEYFPAAFYLRHAVSYATRLEELPPEADCVLARIERGGKAEKKRRELLAALPGLAEAAQFSAGPNELLLLQRQAAAGEDSRPLTPGEGKR